MATRRKLKHVRRVVVKVGSGLVTDSVAGADARRIGHLAKEIAQVRSGREIVLVTSGAIVTGMARLSLERRPRSIPEKQAAAAVGQSALMWHYEAAFNRHGIHVGQVLLTGQDIADRTRYLNARNTLVTLLRFGVLPIVNENDTVAVDEIKVGDNDNLSAHVAALIDADLLVLLTDVDGLYTGDPDEDATAKKIDTVETMTDDILKLAGTHMSTTSVGGMATKLEAAQKAMASGVPMVIASGDEPGALARILSGEPVGTYFAPRADRLAARKRWIAFAVPPHGSLVVDPGAFRALVRDGKSLLPSGVVDVEGDFAAGAVVAVVTRGAAGATRAGWDAARTGRGAGRADGGAGPVNGSVPRATAPGGREFARGLVNYDADEVRRIQGAKTRDIEARLGYRSVDEVIHRDNLVIL